MIFDNLLEKKDVIVYLELRRDFLKSALAAKISKIDEKDRAIVEERFKGRISELNLLIDEVGKDVLNDSSKWYYRRLHENDGVEN